MANVPAPGLPDVAPDEVPTPYRSTAGVTPDAFGAGAGRSIERVGGVARELYEQEKQYADTAAVLGAEGQAKQALNDVILDDQNGYRSLHGADAIAGRDPALQKFQKAITTAGSTLTNDAQRLHFQKLAQTIQQEGYHWALSHEATEQERYAVAKYRGNVDQTMVTMENPGVVSDPSAIRRQIDSLFQVGIEEARRRYGENASQAAIASVVVPELQKAALGTLNAAVAISERTGDPAVAKQAFDQVGKYLVSEHQRQYAKWIEALSTKALVDAAASKILAASTGQVPVPGSPIAIPRIDEVRTAAGLAAVSPDSPHAAEIDKAVAQRQQVGTRLWNAAVGTVAQRVESAAQKGDSFDLSRASAVDLEWLRQNAPDDLRKLRGYEQKGDRAASLEAWSTLSADMANPGRKDFYSNLTVPEFDKLTRDQGIEPRERRDAMKLFTAMLNGAQTEKVNATVREQLDAAFKNNPQLSAKLHGPVFDATNKWIETWKAQAEGKGPTTDQIRAFINRELVVGGPWYSRTRRVQFEADLANAGKTFQPAGTDIPAPIPVKAASPVAAPARIGVVNGVGQHFSIPADQLDDFLKSEQGKGFRRE